VDDLWATKSEGVGLSVRAISLIPTYVILIHQRHRQTDRRTTWHTSIYLFIFYLVIMDYARQRHGPLTRVCKHYVVNKQRYQGVNFAVVCFSLHFFSALLKS